MIAGIVLIILAIPLLLLFFPLGLALGACGVLLILVKLLRSSAAAATVTARAAYRSATTKHCPDCRLRIPADAVVCGQCGYRYEAQPLPSSTSAGRATPRAPAAGSMGSPVAPAQGLDSFRVGADLPPADAGAPSQSVTPPGSPELPQWRSQASHSADIGGTVFAAGSQLARTTALVLGRGVGSMAARYRSLDRRVRWTAVTGVIAVPLLLVAGVWWVSTANSPDARLREAMQALARREAVATIANSSGLAQALGIAVAPASVDFGVTDWAIDPEGAAYRASFALVATGNGQSSVAQASLVLSPVGSTFVWRDVAGSLDADPLVAGVPDAAAAERLADETRNRNAAFGVPVNLRRLTVIDGEAPLPPRIERVDPQLLSDGQPVVINEGTQATVEQVFLDVGDRSYLVLLDNRQPAKPTEVLVGSLDKRSLTVPAAETLERFAALQREGDVVGAAALLVDGADLGLDGSGLAASSIGTHDAAALSVVGERGAYRVTTSAGTVLHQIGGQWLIDYTGQPLRILAPCGSTTFNPARQGHDSTWSTRDPKWNIVYGGNKVVVVTGGQNEPELFLQITSPGEGEWERVYWQIGTVQSVRIDDQKWEGDELAELRHEVRRDLSPWRLELPAVVAALRDASEVEVKYRVEAGWDDWHKDMTQRWSTDPSCQD